jgi:xylulokinase
VTIDVPVDGDFGASLGAARLGSGGRPEGRTERCLRAAPMNNHSIPAQPHSAYADAYRRWRSLYPALKQAGF